MPRHSDLQILRRLQGRITSAPPGASFVTALVFAIVIALGVASLFIMLALWETAPIRGDIKLLPPDIEIPVAGCVGSGTPV